MKIMFFIPNIEKNGGVERAAISLINSLAEHKNVHIFLTVFNADTMHKVYKEISPRVCIISLGVQNYRTGYIKLLFSLRKEIIKSKVEFFINIETLSLLFSLLPVLFLKNAPKLVVWEHFNFKNDNGKKLRSVFRKLAGRYADLIVTLTQRDVNMWENNIKLKSKITYIYNISPFQNIDVVYNKDSKTVISIGRFVSIKGFDRLIKAWGIFERKYKINDWHLNIIGYGEGERELNDIILKESTKNVSLIDGSTDIVQHYQSASFYCMTSYMEGLPMVLIEAQNFGLPSIAFDIYSGPSEIIGIGCSGLLIEDNNLDAYADSIYKLISDLNLRKKFSKSAVLNSNRFTSDIIAREWMNKLQNLAL